MRFFINIDENNKLAQDTRQKLVRSCQKHQIQVVDEVTDADILCSIGGDGTFLQTSHLSDGKPTIGINCGTLGYLTDVNPNDIDKALTDILNNNYFIEERMMLTGQIIKKDGRIIKVPDALNDITISKNTLGILRFDCIIDEKLINSYTADGIIVSTPTGSTAYNLSCGGPIVDPTASLITLTPIAPHTIINRSIILSDDSIVEIKIKQIRNNSKSFVLYDGRPLEINEDDIIKIYKSSMKTSILKLSWQSFVENIRHNIH